LIIRKKRINKFSLPVSRQEIINKISKNFPNLYKKDITRLIDIFLNEITKALSNGERVELRDVMMFETRVQKERLSINPRTLEKFKTPTKKTIIFKSSKEWKNKLNEKK
tara:strand:- start:491 stop:817 length:327 start_codon:yes stop_codon:yes gene_type:complete